MKKLPLIDNFIISIVGEDVFYENREELVKCVVAYILRIYNHIHFKTHTSYLTSDVRKLLRMKIREQSILILNFKMAILLSLFDIENAKGIFKKCNIDWGNRNVLPLLKEWGFISKLKTKVKKKLLLYPEDIKNKCGKLIVGLDSYLNRYINKKLRFIYKSNNLSNTDIKGSLVSEGIMCYYNEVPFKIEEHLNNLVKSKITSTGCNIIKHYKTQKRDRLKQQEDGTFLGTVISVNQGSEGEEFDVLERTDSGDNNGTSVFRDTRYTQSLNKLKYIYLTKNFDKKYQALNILSLNNDKKFLDWYNKERKKKFELVEDIYDFEGSTQFMKYVRAYFNASDRSWKSFIDEVKIGLGDI
jgi:hypothetical protein